MSTQFSDLLFQGPINIVASFLIFVDRLMLSRTSKRLNVLLSPISIDDVRTLLIKRLIANFGFTRAKAHEFLNTIHDSGSYIYSSMLSQIVLINEWSDLDLDLHICIPNINQNLSAVENDITTNCILHVWLKNNGFSRFSIGRSVFVSQDQLVVFPPTREYRLYDLSVRLSGGSSLKECSEIQTIICPNDDPLEFIETFFHPDNKIAYNGKKLFISNPEHMIKNVLSLSETSPIKL
jgi:hypothetical protein